MVEGDLTWEPVMGADTTPSRTGPGPAPGPRRTDHERAALPEPVRRVALAGGRELVVRPVVPVDVGGLTQLYDELDEEARRRRFFSAYRPDHRFFAHLVGADDRGGAELVAVVTGRGGAWELVGEAGYEPLPNGNGELAIVVARAWRGWLGPFLLDALLDVAAARGVPNLEADVLMTNRTMLAVLRARGLASLPQADWTIQRVVVGAATRDPSWPEHRTGTRVLVEGGGARWHGHEAAEAAGLQVMACSGPTSRRHCPALEGRPCPLVQGADVAVLAYPPDAPEWERLRAAHPAVHHGVPVCLEPLRGDLPRAGEEVVPAGSGAEVVAAVEERARTGLRQEPDREPDEPS